MKFTINYVYNVVVKEKIVECTLVKTFADHKTESIHHSSKKQTCAQDVMGICIQLKGKL